MQNADQARFCSGCGGNIQTNLEQFLEQYGLENLASTLCENDFSSPEELLSLNDDDFKELGITVGQKMRLKKALLEIEEECSPNEGDEDPEEESGQTRESAEQAMAQNLARLSSVERVYLAPNIPQDKLSVAVQSYVRKQGVEVILLYDVTFFQGAKDGFVVAQDGLYLKESFQSPEYYPYISIRNVYADESSKLFINNKQVMNCIGIAPISLRRITAIIALLSGTED